MEKFSSPIEVRVRLFDVGHDVVSVSLESSLQFPFCDGQHFAYAVLSKLLVSSSGLRRLYDGSFIIAGTSERPFPSFTLEVPTVERVIELPAEEYELSDGKLHNVAFKLNQAEDFRHDYPVNHTRYLRLLGVAVIEDVSDEEGK